MSIQILQLREYTDKKTNTQKIAVKTYKGLVAPSIDELFINTKQIVDKIAEQDRWNIFYTLANCDDSAKMPRVFLSQDVIPFDIDGIDHKREHDYIKYVCDVLNVLPTDIGIVASGNGFHFLIRVDSFDSVKFFSDNKLFYKAVCSRINAKLKERGLTGKADTTAFEPRRIFRVPLTENRKPNKPVKQCVLLNPVLGPVDFNLRIASGIENIKAGSHVAPEALKKLNFAIDTKAVLNGCDFLKYCKLNQAKISEPEWKAMVSILTHIDGGKILVHAYSNEHPNYSEEETNDKFEQAKVLTGARTCKGINESVFDCSKCKNFDKVTCPVFIKGADFIGTKSTGFYTIISDPMTGIIKKRIPHYQDLKKYFVKKNDAVIIGSELYYYKDEFWNKMSSDDITTDVILKDFAMKNFIPNPARTVRSDFFSEVYDDLSVRKSIDIFNSTTENKINLNNGVYDLKKREILKHDKKFGFTYKLDYDYDVNAAKPVNFLKFMEEITEGDKDVERLLLEYGGYMLSGDRSKKKCLFLYGVAGTAKSTFGEVLQMLVPESSYSNVKAEHFHKDTHRNMMFGKLFNVGDETHPKSFVKSGEDFKTMVTGGRVDGKVLFKNPFTFKFRTKILLTGNELPYNYDSSNALYSRLIPVEFTKVFRDTVAENLHIVDTFVEERAGILKLFADAYSKVGEHFDIPKSCAKGLSAYKQSNDSVHEWLKDGVQLNSDKFCTLGECVSHYRSYCEEENLPFMHIQRSVFSKMISNKLKVDTSRKSVNGRQTRVFNGVELLG